MAIATATVAPSILRRPIMRLVLLELECRTHGEVELAELVPRSRVWIDAVVDADGPEGRVPAQAHAHRVLEAREVDLRSEVTVGAIHVARVEEEGQLDPPESRDGVLHVAEDLEVAADPRARIVPRGDLTELEAADGIGAAEVEALEEGHGSVVPADLVAGAETRAHHVPEPQRLVLYGGGGESDVAVVVGEDAREVGPDGGEVSLGGIEEAVAGVAPDGPAEDRIDDGALLGARAAAQAEEHLPAPAEEIVLGEVEGAEGAVLGAVAAADGEEAGGLLRHLDVDDDLVLGGTRRRPRLHLLEVVQVAQLLLGPGELLGGEQVPLVHGDLAAQDLLLAPGIARDIDALDEDLGPFGDLEGDVDLPVRHVEGELGIDVGGGAPDAAVHVAESPRWGGRCCP